MLAVLNCNNISYGILNARQVVKRVNSLAPCFTMFLPSFQPQHSLKEMCSMRNILLLASCLLWITGSLANKPIDYSKENLYSSSVRELSKLLELENHFMSKVNAYADTVQEKLETLKV